MLNLDSLGLAAIVTDSGISAPDYQTILSRLTGYFWQIYGANSYLEPNSKDGKMIAIYALAMHDANNAIIAAYNSYSPATSTGAALSNYVRVSVEIDLTAFSGYTMLTSDKIRSAVAAYINA